MTEGCEDKDSLVRVRAQVMTRDDSSGGWVPMDGGGLSNVSVRKRSLASASAAAVSVSSLTTSTGVTALHASVNGGSSSRCSSTSGPGPPPSPPLTGVATPPPPPCHCNSLIQHEYLILGKRISDQTVVLSCTIGKDFQYNKVMPTFHHWRTGDQKFGLTFQTAADARAFDKGVRMAVEDLLDGLSSDTPALRHMNSDASEDDVFMTLDLPMERNELRSSSSSSQFQPHHHHHQQPQQQQQQLTQPLQPQMSTTAAPTTGSSPVPTPVPPSAPSPPLPKEHHLHRIHFMTQRRTPTLNSSTSSLPLLSNSINEGLTKDNLLTAEQLMWQQRDQELALTRERERAAKEKERQRREGEGIWSTTGIGGVLNDHIELDKESYSYVQFAREGVGNAGGVGGPGGTLHAAALHSLHSLHEYSYPVIPDPASKVTAPLAPATRRDSISSLKKNQMTSVTTSTSTAPMLPNKAGRGKKKRRGSNSSSCSNKLNIGHLHQPASGKTMGRIRCKHCQDTFRPEENGRGACEYAPDCVRSTIDAVSCVGCAQCLLYHCYADSEGDFTPTPHRQCPCSCASFGSGGSSSSNGGSGTGGGGNHHHHHQRRGSTCCVESSPKRWFGLALLSLVVPCLWCYLPLRACYRCGVQCGCCGKPHEAA